MNKLLILCLATLFAAPAAAQITVGTPPRALPAATAPLPTDSIVCDPTTGATKRCTPAQIVSAGGVINAAMAGVVYGGADNAAKVDAINNLLNTSASSRNGYSVRFSQDPSATAKATVYYFSAPLDLHRPGLVTCDGTGNAGASGVDLLFAAGVDGVVQDSNTTSSDAGVGEGSVENCGIKSQGEGTGNPTRGSGVITGVSMVAVDGIASPTFEAGDGVIAVEKHLSSSVARPLAVPTGAEVGSMSGTTMTLAGGVVVDADTTTVSNKNLVLFRLPAALADTANTTSGSSTVTITGGTTKFYPGDLIWSSAFPWWSRVGATSGATGAQTLTIEAQFLTASQAATATTTGSHIWRVPAGVRRLIPSMTKNLTIQNWPIGIDMPCSSAWGINCTSSKDYTDFVILNMVGRYAVGNNTGASTDFASEFADNYFTDIFEGGTLGSAYIGTNSNSGESQSLQPVIGNCANQNYSAFIGSYIGAASQWTYCVQGAGGTAPVMIQPQGANPIDAKTWASDGITAGARDTFALKASKKVTITAASYDSATGNVVVTTNAALGANVGDAVSVGDAWGQGDPRSNFAGQRVVQAGSSGTTLDFTIAPNLTGLVISGGTVGMSDTLPCAVINGGSGFDALTLLDNCITGHQKVNFRFDQVADSLAISGDNLSGLGYLRFTVPGYANYVGDGSGYTVAPRGIVLGDGAANEHLIFNAAGAPANSWNKQGDFYFNNSSLPGGQMGWIDTAGGANFFPAGPVSADSGGLSWNLGEIISTGTQPTFSGTCAVGSITGGSSAGSFVTPSACAATLAVTITFPVAAPNGWVCLATDETGPVMIAQKADTTTTCRLSMPATAAGDKIVWSARGY